MTKIKLLVEILEDPAARVDEKDDAAMELEGVDDDIALQGLIRCALDPDTDEMVQTSCGESIASIWILRNQFDSQIYQQMPKWARDGVYFKVEARKPEWLKQYNIT